MMNIMGVIPYEQYAGIDVNARPAQIASVHRVPQGEEDSRKEQNHSKKLWESSYKNNFDRFKELREREEQGSFHFGNPMDVLEISQEALELLWSNSMTNIQAEHTEDDSRFFGYPLRS
jgi:hypothetical protein